MADTNMMGRLNGYLFDELERLSALDVGDADAVRSEIARSKAIEGLAQATVNNANVILRVSELRCEYSNARFQMPKQFEG